jgi:mannose-1-phosphate guanylyltransferase
MMAPPRHGPASIAPTARDNRWGLVLAGGDGVRLQALTRALTGVAIPKQYCRLTGDRSMLEATLDRIAPLVPAHRTLTIVNRDHLEHAHPQLQGLPASNVLVQPQNRDTGPGLLFGLHRLGLCAPCATVAVFPSDHYVREDGVFLAHVARAFDLVQRFPEKIVLLGMTPDRADPGLGYLELGRRLRGAGNAGVFRVAAFVEKPGVETAARIIRRGALWNTFVMLFRLETMIALLRRRRPSDCDALSQIAHADYASLPAWNFSRDFLAHVAEELLVLRVGDVGWSDWGTPEAVERTLLDLNIVPPWWTATSAGPVPAEKETSRCA